MKLQNKILLLLVPLTVVPLLALGWSAYSQLQDTAMERTTGQMTTLLDQVGLQKETQLRIARANAKLFASGALVEKFIKRSEHQEFEATLAAETREQFFSYQLAYPEYYEIRLTTRHGVEKVRSVLGKPGDQKSSAGESAYFRNMLDNKDSTYVSYFTHGASGQPAMLVSKPLYLDYRNVGRAGTSQKLWGFLTITLGLDFLEKQVRSGRIGNSGYLFLTDSQGKILFQSEASLLGEALSRESFQNLQKVTLEGRAFNGSIEGEPVYVKGQRLTDQLWLFASLPRKELLAESRRLGFLVAGITVVAMVVTIAFLFVVLRILVVQPIQKLSRAAHEVGKGKVRVSVDISSDDEIGDLANSFTEMGVNLEQYHEQARYLAYHDGLTGLPNRTMFNEYLHHALAEARRDLQEVAVLFMDLDNFKRINDTLGHHSGDQLLEEFAVRIRSCIRASDVVVRNSSGDASELLARWAGDEFIILLPRLGGSAEAQRVAQRIQAELSRPFMLGRQEVSISTSIGISIFPEDGVTVEKLVKNADIAMYHAKKLGRNNYQFFSSSLNKQMMQRLTLENKLHRALQKNEFALVYQPQVDTKTGKIIGVEALLRWREMELGSVSPAVFIPIAEESGLIVPITKWVLKEACRQAREWSDAGHNELVVSVNISGVHVNRDDLEPLVAATLKATGLPAHQLELEVTETSIVDDPMHAAEVLNRLKAMGLMIALDDFGTGYSSLSQLRRLPIDKLKIDQSFIRDMETDNDGEAIVTAIIAMGHSLHLKVIAEGVENEQQLALLEQKGCDQLQGYYCAEPLRPQDITGMLQQNLKRPA